jgi:hypothetical protein
MYLYRLDDVRRFMKKVAPYLVFKREHAEIAAEFFQLKDKFDPLRWNEYVVEFDRLRRQLHDLAIKGGEKPLKLWFEESDLMLGSSQLGQQLVGLKKDT